MRSTIFTVLLLLVTTRSASQGAVTVTYPGPELAAQIKNGMLEISNAEIHGPVSLGGAATPGELRSVKFDRVYFDSDATIYLDRMDGAFECNRCTFAGELRFPSLFLRRLKLFDVAINGRLRLDHGVANSISILRSVVSGTVDAREMRVANFDVYDVQLGGANFLGARFGAFSTKLLSTDHPIRIRWKQFGESWLTSRRENAKFQATLHGGAGDDVLAAEKANIANDLVEWRTNFEALGYVNDGAEARAAYEIYRRTDLDVAWTDRCASILLSVPNEYGSRPLRPFWIAACVIVLFGVTYWVRDPFVPASTDVNPLTRAPRLIFAMCFSLDTFLPFVTITGVKDWGWRIDDGCRWLVTAEQVLGVTITSVAAYSLSLLW